MQNDIQVLIVGIGALGGVFSYKLVKSGYKYDLVTNNDTITKTINNSGIVYESEDFRDTIKANAMTALPEGKQYDYIFLMMKSMAVKNACREIQQKKLLKETGLVITIQNGDIYDQVQEFFPGKIVTGILGWNSIMLGPGKYRITSPGSTIIGDRNNKLNLGQVKDVLAKISPKPIEITNNILGIVWAKLCISCAINAISGISGLTIGGFLKYKSGKELYLAVYRETFELAMFQNIKLEKTPVNPYLMYLPMHANFLKKSYKMFIMKQVGKRFGSVKPSTLQDIEKGRKTEIEFLNGYVTKKGEDLNYKTPLNDKLTELIKSIENGDLKPSIENLSLINLQ